MLSKLAIILFAGLIGVALVNAACGGGSTDTEATRPTHTEATPTERFVVTFTDVFSYCGAIGTIDAPDARWAGPAVPERILSILQQELGPGINPDGTSWRCMDGKVLGCNVGANLPCGPANTSDVPTSAMNEFCAENPQAPRPPFSLTGHDTLYSWSCIDGHAQVGEEAVHTDGRGFIAEYWYEISPGLNASAATPAVAAGTPREAVEVYTVSEGDTVASIADEHGISLGALLAANPELRDGELLEVGQMLVIPPGEGITYSVRRGETLRDIADRYGVSMDDILNYPGNQISSADQLAENQIIFIPGAVSPTPTP